MTPAIRIIAAVGSLAILSACGGSSADPAVAADLSASVAFLERADNNAALRESLDRAAGTAYLNNAFPASGSATYNGFATASLAGGTGAYADGLTVQGDMTLTATFGDGSASLTRDGVTGTVTNLRGYTGDQVTDTNLVDVGGSIVIGQVSTNIGFGDPADNDVPNQFRSSYSASLDGGQGTFAASGIVEGRFRGTRVDPPAGKSVVRGLVGNDDDGIAQVGGERRVFTLEIAAEN